MGKKFRSIFIASFLVLGVTGCDFDGSYRYPCQDPTNWEKAECKPPICTTNGACPVDLVGEDVYNSGSEQTSESGATDNG